VTYLAERALIGGVRRRGLGQPVVERQRLDRRLVPQERLRLGDLRGRGRRLSRAA